MFIDVAGLIDSVVTPYRSMCPAVVNFERADVRTRQFSPGDLVRDWGGRACGWYVFVDGLVL